MKEYELKRGQLLGLNGKNFSSLEAQRNKTHPKKRIVQ